MRANPSLKRSAADVHNWAEARYATVEWESDNEVTNEVLVVWIAWT